LKNASWYWKNFSDKGLDQAEHNMHRSMLSMGNRANYFLAGSRATMKNLKNWTVHGCSNSN
jgi:hypothetical protein